MLVSSLRVVLNMQHSLGRSVPTDGFDVTHSLRVNLISLSKSYKSRSFERSDIRLVREASAMPYWKRPCQAICPHALRWPTAGGCTNDLRRVDQSDAFSRQSERNDLQVERTVEDPPANAESYSRCLPGFGKTRCMIHPQTEFPGLNQQGPDSCRSLQRFVRDRVGLT
jgi:hypothetical protein